MASKKEILNTSLIKTHKTCTPEEILSAGGATLFGRKMKKNNATLIEALQKVPDIEPFTEEEWNMLQLQVARDK